MALTIAEDWPGETMNPFVIAGPPGAGKSHLLSAIYFELRRQPNVAIRGTSADRLVDLVRDERAELARYDVLLIDDLRDRCTFAYLFETLDIFARHGGQVVITTRSDADALDDMRRWVKQFEWGYIAFCEKLDRPTPGEARGSRTPFDLDHDFLREVGLDHLCFRQADRVLEAAYQRLEVKVGERVVRTGLRRLERLGVVDEDGVRDDLDYAELQAALPVLRLVIAEEFVALQTKMRDESMAIALIESAESHLAEFYVQMMKGSAPFVTEA